MTDRERKMERRWWFVIIAALTGVLVAQVPGLSVAQTVSFGSPTTFPAGSAPYGVAIADLNRDGIADLVVGNNSSANISVFLGTGTGSFGAATNFSVGNQPNSVAVGDLNADGNPDLAVANFASGNVSILLGDGAGGFAAAAGSPISAGVSPNAIVIGDLNLDGNQDLAVAGPGGLGGEVVVVFGNGTGGFGVPVPGTVGSQPISLAIGDLNRDGILDLAVANNGSNTVSIVLGFGPITSIGLAPGALPHSVAIGDLNRDGKLDLAVANSGAGFNNVSVLLGDGTGAFGPVTNFSAGTTPFSVAMGDLNGDGNLDLAVANDNSYDVSVLPGDGTGNFGAATNFSFGLGNTPISVAIGDLNRDGRADVVATLPATEPGGAVVLLNTTTFSPAGTFGSATSLPTGSFPDAVATGDVNRDGIPDLAVANFSSDTISVLIGTPTGFNSALNFAVGNGPTSVFIGDVNRDGVPDLAVSNRNDSTVSILLGTGTSSLFGVATNFPVANGPEHVAIGDLNRDGIPDLAVANRGVFGTDNRVSILLGTGTPSLFGAATDFTVGTNPFSVAIGDLNRDGNPDLAVANNLSSSVSILLGTGTASLFGGATNFTVGTEPYDVVIGDFNRDGIPDVATANVVDDSVSVLLGTGTSALFGPATTFPTSVSPEGLATADVNRDGILDLVTANFVGNNVSILQGSGTGSFSAAPGSPVAVGSQPVNVAIGDFNRDGKLDLATANFQGNTVSILLNSAPAAPFTLAPSPASRTVVQGQSTTYTITVTPQSGFSSPVSLSLTSALPAGASASFSPDSVTPPGTATLIVSTSGTTTPDDYTLNLQGTGNSQTNTTSVSLTVTAPSGGAAPLALTPTITTVPGGSQVTFGATGGTGSYTFTLLTNQSNAMLVGSTYTAGGTAGTDTVQVSDGVNTAQAIVTVTTAALTPVNVSLDGRALAALGPAQTFNVEASSGSTFLVGLTTDRVHDLKLPTGAYRLTAGAGSLNFSVGPAACMLTLP